MNATTPLSRIKVTRGMSGLTSRAGTALLTGLSDATACRAVERPHPGTQLFFTDVDGHRFQVLLTNQPGGRIARHEAVHRSRAAIEDSIRCGKASGFRNLPFRSYAMNEAWLGWTDQTPRDRSAAPRRPQRRSCACAIVGQGRIRTFGTGCATFVKDPG